MAEQPERRKTVPHQEEHQEPEVTAALEAGGGGKPGGGEAPGGEGEGLKGRTSDDRWDYLKAISGCVQATQQLCMYTVCA